jgi:hypothetical protein
LVLLLTAAVSVAAAQSQAPPAAPNSSGPQAIDAQTIVSRMEQAQLENRTRYRAYTVTREYRMYSGASETPASEVVAQVNFVPPGTKTFDIEQTSGSFRGAKVVKNILEAESENAPHYQRSALTRDNYDFEYLGLDTFQGRPCHLLQLTPKRKETDLIRGRAWVDSDTYLVHRVEGELSKSPSWWLKSVHVVLDFNDVSGMWLQTRTHALAEVRIFGDHTLESEPLRYETAASVAQKSAAPLKKRTPTRSRRPEAVAGSAVFLPH